MKTRSDQTAALPAAAGDDEDARREALDPARSFIVQAPAGSGKTGLLTQRFLRLLAVVDAPEQIVAITFTRKAAAEMRRRILEALRADKPAAGAENGHDRLTRELAAAARAHAAARGWALEAHPARLRIQTIDAFCHSLAAQLPLLARAGSELQVSLEPKELYAQAARRALAQVEAGSETVQTVLLHRDNQFLQTESMLVSMLARRDQWLPLIVGRDHAELRRQLEEDLQLELQAHLQELVQLWPPENLAAVCRLAAICARNLDAAAAPDERMPQAHIDDLPRWRQLCSLLLNGDGEWRRRYTVREGFPAQMRAEKAELLDLIAELDRVDGLRTALGLVSQLPPERFSDEQWTVACALLELLKLASAELELVFRESGQVDFPAVAQAALQSLGDEQSPSELALALDYRIRHLLVDEFQDTSYLQNRLLEKLTAGWTDGDGRTLFCVGDPMQSIYRFRQAEVGLFLLARERGIGQVQLRSLRLSRNFRSVAPLVDWFNRLFAQVLPPRDDLSRGAVSFAPSQAATPAAGGDAAPTVHVHPAFANQPLAEGLAVAAKVQDILARRPQCTVGILVRQRNHAAAVAAALRARGVRFQAVELEALSAQPVVQDLLALTRSLLHPGDRTARLALLRSPVCGLTLADLEALARAESPGAAELSPDGRRRMQRVEAILDRAREFEGRLPMRAWVERTWIALGGPAVIGDARALDDAAAFFERLETLAQRGLLSVGPAFDELFSELFARPDAAAPPNVQLMTIHKAKGLEFDVVILPGLGRGQGRNDPPLLQWLEVPRPGRRASLLLAPIAARGSQADPLSRYLALRERECAEHEKARLLYVALTRARSELHLFGHVRTLGSKGEVRMGAPDPRSMLALLWPAVREEFEQAFHLHAAPAAESLIQTRREALLRRLPAAWAPPATPEVVGVRVHPPDETAHLPRPEFDWAGEESRLVGILVHAQLERWAQLERLPAADEIEAMRARFLEELRSLGLPRERLERSAQRVVQALRGVIGDERGRWLFDAGHRDRASELAITGLDGGAIVSVVIDRTFVDGQGVRWIVDFKTSVHEGADVEGFLDREVERYRPQLERYARLLGALETSSRPVRLGLYFPLLKGWREWAPEAGGSVGA